jgi:adenylate cyclase
MIPGYAPAWSGLAHCYVLLGATAVLPGRDAYLRARSASQKALELDSGMVESLVMLANVKNRLDWDWAGAEQLYKRAIELDPHSEDAHRCYAVHLAEVGRVEEALAEARRGAQVEPLSYGAGVWAVWFSYIARHYDQAEPGCHKLLAWQPKDNFGHTCLASVYLQTGRVREVPPELRAGPVEGDRTSLGLMYLGHGLGIAGARAEGQRPCDAADPV